MISRLNSLKTKEGNRLIIILLPKVFENIMNIWNVVMDQIENRPSPFRDFQSYLSDISDWPSRIGDSPDW